MNNFLNMLISSREMVGVVLLVLIVVLCLIGLSIVLVPGNKIAIVERRWLGRKMPRGRVVAMPGQVGILAKTLEPGLHFILPFVFTVRKIAFQQIGVGEVGLVESIDGEPVPTGRIFAKVVPEHDAFQDGVKFLANGGQKGPQLQILPPGTYRINSNLFHVNKVKPIVVGTGQIGIVTAMDGQPIPSGKLLGESVPGHDNFQDGQAFLENGGQRGPQLDILLPGTYRINTALFKVGIKEAMVVPPSQVGLVLAKDGLPLPDGERIAKMVSGHDDYQNAHKFLAQGGQRGPQLEILRPGTYYINPLMFKVELDDIIEVERGDVAVYISNVGLPPTEEMKAHQATFDNSSVHQEAGVGERYVVPKGYRGIWEEVAGPGHYYLNRWAYIPHIIRTTNQTFEWENSAKTRFDSLKVISKDGFLIDITLKIVVRVWPEQCPYLVAKVGSVDILAQDVIHPMIESQFRNQASSISAMNFLLNREDEQARAHKQVRAELRKYYVECVSVLICQVSLPEELMQTQTRRIIAEQQTEMFARQQVAEEARIATEKTRATADQQIDLVRAEIDSKAAYEVKSTTITIAEGKAREIEVISQAKADAYRLQSEILGEEAITAIEIIRQVAEGKIKITPEVMAGAGQGGLMDVVLAQLVRDGKGWSAPARAIQASPERGATGKPAAPAPSPKLPAAQAPAAAKPRTGTEPAATAVKPSPEKPAQSPATVLSPEMQVATAPAAKAQQPDKADAPKPAAKPSPATPAKSPAAGQPAKAAAKAAAKTVAANPQAKADGPKPAKGAAQKAAPAGAAKPNGKGKAVSAA
jgi:regulator of protease activity HflC (stomatin/prohibitin superfamily)